MQGDPRRYARSPTPGDAVPAIVESQSRGPPAQIRNVLNCQKPCPDAAIRALLVGKTVDACL